MILFTLPWFVAGFDLLEMSSEDFASLHCPWTAEMMLHHIVD